ncbi:hypothetical protein [Mesonia sp.]|uniref:hypothetical protein n=1 Tax=Mesonia sp. TaxID=1960830 RepID=UPI00176F7BAB|nr:hypothetical protein [Mesonia sp.]HIB37963.1 hypothetical protein [Mesonia sp.]HIO26597.1 hypothetical protein [Flavobacteriaceae bacterium]
MKRILLISALVAFTFSLNAQSTAKLVEAEQRMQKYSDDDILAVKNIDEVLNEDPTNEKANYLRALAHLEGGGYRYATKRITKAIEQNPTNIEYRWIRIKSLMNSHSEIEQWQMAVNDLNFLLNKEDRKAKVLANLSFAEMQLADSWMNSLLEDKEINALKHYKLALEAGDKAVNLDDNYSGRLKLLDIKKSIAELQKA